MQNSYYIYTLTGWGSVQALNLCKESSFRDLNPPDFIEEMARRIYVFSLSYLLSMFFQNENLVTAKCKWTTNQRSQLEILSARHFLYTQLTHLHTLL